MAANSANSLFRSTPDTSTRCEVGQVEHLQLATAAAAAVVVGLAF